MDISTPQPGFKAFNPYEAVRIYTRHLPHWRQKGCTYFVTFHLADALPIAVQRSLNKQRRDLLARASALEDLEFEKHLQQLMQEEQNHLDLLHGSCWLGNPDILTKAREAMTFHEGTKMDTWCYVIMPNHAHALVRPINDAELEDVMGSIKAFLTQKIRAEFGQIKKVWQQESFDRIVRDKDHLRRCIQYIGNNPKKAGLQAEPLRWVHPKWRELGWKFIGSTCCAGSSV